MERRGPLDAPSVMTGIYVALLACGVGSVLGLERAALIVGGLLGWLVLAFVLTARPWVWVVLGRQRLLSVPMIAPFGPAIGLAIALQTGVVGDVWRTGLYVSVALTLLGIGIQVTGTSAYARQAAGDRSISWECRTDATRRRRKRLATWIVAIVAVLGLVATVAFGLPSLVSVMAAGVAGGLWGSLGQRLTFDVCEHGLQRRQPGVGGIQFTPWEQFDSYRETDGAVVLERRWWVDHRLAADEVPGAARDALEAAIDG